MTRVCVHMEEINMGFWTRGVGVVWQWATGGILKNYQSSRSYMKYCGKGQLVPLLKFSKWLMLPWFWFCFVICFFGDKVSRSSSWSQTLWTHYVLKNDLKLLISHLHTSNAKMIGVHYHTEFMQCWQLQLDYFLSWCSWLFKLILQSGLYSNGPEQTQTSSHLNCMFDTSAGYLP